MSSAKLAKPQSSVVPNRSGEIKEAAAINGGTNPTGRLDSGNDGILSLDLDKHEAQIVGEPGI
jgi:hypothetical protein